MRPAEHLASVLLPCTCVALFALTVSHANADCSALPEAAICTLPIDCPWSTTTVMSYANGAQVRQLGLRRPVPCLHPPGPSDGTTELPFEITMSASFTPAGGGAPVGLDVPSSGLLRARFNSEDVLGFHIDTEIIGLELSGESVIPGMRLRESPTLASLGQFTIKQVPGGFELASFFDVFTELSLDGGQTWLPADEPGHLVASFDPGTRARPSTWGAVKSYYR